MNNIAVVVTTYGSEVWKAAGDRAEISLDCQDRLHEVVRHHSYGDSLAIARNEAANKANADYLIFLDADDRLGHNYVKYMSEADGDIVQPSTLGVYPDGSEDDEPVLIPKKNLLEGNYLVIGSMCSAELFWEVGGFRELPILEDWDLWIRMCIAGASVDACAEAIYRVGVNDGSRNSNGRLHRKVYSEIRSKYRTCGYDTLPW